MSLRHDKIFSPDRKYRYTLWRELAGDMFFDGPNRQKDGFVQIIGLNPSTATDTINDRTIAKLKKFCVKWGYSSFCMTNLFAFRATDPTVMLAEKEPIGPDNNHWLQIIGGQADKIICAWGTKGVHMQRGDRVLLWLRDTLGWSNKLHYLRLTAEKHPEHPLFLPGNLVPIPYTQ